MAAAALHFQLIVGNVEEAFYAPIRKGMADAAEQLGATAEFIGTTGFDADAQSALITAAAENPGVRGIGLQQAAGDMNAAVESCMASGTPVVGFSVDASTPGNQRMSCICQDFVPSGRSLGSLAAASLTEGCTVLLLHHDDGVDCLEQRIQGIKEALQPLSPTFIRAPACGITMESAATVVGAAMEANPGVDVVIASGQSDLEGAALCKQRGGIKPEVLVCT
jgi:simple sugar transport system substrate-binding protein